ncbi:MAG: L-2-hydroxyglutarate oxidase [Chloroflexi bacterium]|nr:MAG: L-2-hydroxyglutarate oxidase [Chloroflexota bacterium]
MGGGIIGLATARELLLRGAGAVTVLEQEPAVAAHQSGHNSGVVHSGVYYRPGSLRARCCVEGARALRELCAEHGVPLVERTKLIVATRREELARLDEIHRRGVANGVAGLRLIGGGEIAEHEPHAGGLHALMVPHVGVVDFSVVTRALATAVTASGGEVRTGVRVLGVEPDAGGVRVRTTAGELRAGAAVLCAGLWSDRLARAAGIDTGLRVVPFRGDFRVLRPGREGLVRGLIYPVPDPALPFLGVHATRRVDGAVWVGPTAVLALARRGYRRGAVDAGDLRALAADPAVWRLCARHWRAGASGLLLDRSPGLVARALRRLLPGVTAADLGPGPSGVRAQAVDARGRLVDDFVLVRRGAVVVVANAPSPAATGALAVARLVADEVERA